MEDEINLEITAYDWKSRKQEIEKYFSETDAQEATKFLIANNIDYVYVPKELFQYKPMGELETIFENQEVGIYHVR